MTDFETWWKTAPVPGEFDDMDECDQTLWKSLVRMAYEGGEAEELLGHLLTVIHRDGGYYQREHGTRVAVDAAAITVCQLRLDSDALKAAREAMEDE